MSTQATFSRIYQQNLWNGTDSVSGPGSGRSATRMLVRMLPMMCKNRGIKSVLDVGCGDGYWMPDLPGYHGIDVAPEAIDLARKAHPLRRYSVGDIIEEVPDKYDLVIVRDVIQHLSLLEGFTLLQNIRKSGSKMLLASTYTGASERHVGDAVNVDISTGDAFCPDLTGYPYALKPPMVLYPDGYDYEDSEVLRDKVKFLGLWFVKQIPEAKDCGCE